MSKTIKEKEMPSLKVNVLKFLAFYFIPLLALFSLFPNSSGIAQGVITTVVGPEAGIGFPEGVFVDKFGDILVADQRNHRIIKVNPATGEVVTVAGTGVRGFAGDNGPATDALLNSPVDVWEDGFENVYFADAGNGRIGKVDSVTGIVTTIVSSNPFFGGVNGTNGIFVDVPGNIFVADFDNDRIFKIGINGFRGAVVDNLTGATFGSGGSIFDSGETINGPKDVFVDDTGKIFIADSLNHRVVKVDVDAKTVTIVAGTGVAGRDGDGGLASEAMLNNPTGVFVDITGNVFIADKNNHLVRKVDTNGIISTVAGNGIPGSGGDGGSALEAQLNFPTRLFVDDLGSIFIADTNNNSIRKVSFDKTAIPIPTTTLVPTTSTIPISNTTTTTIFTTTTTLIPPTTGAPTADFIADQTIGPAPLIVNFTDLSTGNPTEWRWDFGDGAASIEQNPSHTYNAEGLFSVTLTVANSAGEDSLFKPSFINVQASNKKIFTFNCTRNFQNILGRLERLVLQLNENESCTLKLTNFEPGVPVEISSRLRKGLRSAIKIEPARSVTDANGELKVTITALQKGTDWAAWAVKNDKGRFEFSKKMYDQGRAWGMFVEVE